MLEFEIWKVGLEMDILGHISVDVYCLKEVSPTISTSSNLTDKKMLNTLYHYINLYGFTQSSEITCFRVSQGNIVKGYHF